MGTRTSRVSPTSAPLGGRGRRSVGNPFHILFLQVGDHIENLKGQVQGQQPGSLGLGPTFWGCDYFAFWKT